MSEIEDEDEDLLLEQISEIYENVDLLKSDWEGTFVDEMVELSEKVTRGERKFSEKQAEKVRELYRKYVNNDAYGTGRE